MKERASTCFLFGSGAALGIAHAGVIKALEEIQYPSALGETITFTPSNIIKHQGIRGQKILQWQNGRQEVIWPFTVQTADPVYPFPSWQSRK